jgi:[ribosomal protein S5]-alanine N-acetyltransferase
MSLIIKVLKLDNILISTNRFILRPLSVNDVSTKYLSWLTLEKSGGYILYAKQKHSLNVLKEYVSKKEKDGNVLFLGVFEKVTNKHIGNIKYDPIDLESKVAVMGILIGDPEWRGRGVAEEVLLASGEWLKANFFINKIVLGVYKSNIAAIRAYEKTGFIVSKTPEIKPDPAGITMVWNL